MTKPTVALVIHQNSTKNRGHFGKAETKPHRELLLYVVFMLRHRRYAGGPSTKDRSLARFVCPPAFVHFTIVICVSRDCMKTTYL